MSLPLQFLPRSPSPGTSVILLVVYGCYLFFQLKSHTEIYNRPSPKVEKRRQKIGGGDASRGIAQIGKMTATMAGQNAQQMKLQDPDEEPEEPQLSIFVALLTLTISTVLVALCAEFMVRSLSFSSGGLILRARLTINLDRSIPSMPSPSEAESPRPSSG